MYTNGQILTIADTSVRQDSEGRFCVNDLHRASGSHKRHQPSDWLRLHRTQELVAELSTPGIPGVKEKQPLGASPLAVINGGPSPGTYVCLVLVYDYAMWISPAFHVQVIRAYHGQVTAAGQQDAPLPQLREMAAMIGKQSDQINDLKDMLLDVQGFAIKLVRGQESPAAVYLDTPQKSKRQRKSPKEWRVTDDARLDILETFERVKSYTKAGLITGWSRHTVARVVKDFYAPKEDI